MHVNRLISVRSNRIVSYLRGKFKNRKSNDLVTSPIYRPIRNMSSAFTSSKLDLNFQSDGIALVTMKSGDNRFHPETIDEWHQILDLIEGNTECRSMITTGQGKFYSNGLDPHYIKSFRFYQRQLSEYLDKFNRFLMRVLLFPLPTVAAINGHAFAGGALLALAHDRRVMSEDKGWICLNEILFDGRFPPFHMEMIRCKITSAQARSQTLFFAKRFTAQDAMNSGIVDKVTSQSQLVKSAKLLANEAVGTDGLSRENLGLFKKDLYEKVLRSRIMPEESLKLLQLS